MSRLLRALSVLVAGGLLIACGPSAPTGTNGGSPSPSNNPGPQHSNFRLPKGYHWVSDSQHTYQVALPDDWQVHPDTRSDIITAVPAPLAAPAPSVVPSPSSKASPTATAASAPTREPRNSGQGAVLIITSGMAPTAPLTTQVTAAKDACTKLQATVCEAQVVKLSSGEAVQIHEVAPARRGGTGMTETYAYALAEKGRLYRIVLRGPQGSLPANSAEIDKVAAASLTVDKPWAPSVTSPPPSPAKPMPSPSPR